MKINLNRIVQDSPHFQAEIRQLENQTKDLHTFLSRIVKLSTQISQAAKVMSNYSRQFADEISSYHRYSFASNADPAFVKQFTWFGSMIHMISESLNLNYSQFEQAFSHPLQEFLDLDFNSAKESRKNLDKISAERDAILAKYISMSSKKDSKKQNEIKKEYRRIQEKYILANFDLESILRQIEQKQKFEFLERICSLMYLQIAYFHQGHDLLNEKKSFLDNLTTNLEDVKKTSDLFSQKKDEKRQKLKKLLSKQDVIQPKNKSDLEKAGYLFKLSSSGVKVWQRRFFVVKNHQIYYYRDWKDLSKVGIVNLTLCSIKPRVDRNRRNCFEIISPQKTYNLQAESEAEAKKWIEIVQNNISAVISNYSENEGKQKNNENEEIIEELKKIPGNNKCSECGAENPEWSSINFGNIVCIECAGIMRSLQKQPMRVRSLLLDKWEPQVVEIMKILGNNKLNGILEANINENRPNPNDDPQIKKKFIERKYEKREFVRNDFVDKEEKDPEKKQQLLNLKCYKAVKEENIEDLFQCLVHGAQVDWKNPNDYDNTPLHIAALGSQEKILELLLLNTFVDINVVNGTRFTPMHSAVLNNNVIALKRLLHYGADLYPSNPQLYHESFVSALELAKNQQYYECLNILNEMKEKHSFIFTDKSANKPMNKESKSSPNAENQRRKNISKKLLPESTMPKRKPPPRPEIKIDGGAYLPNDGKIQTQKRSALSKLDHTTSDSDSYTSEREDDGIKRPTRKPPLPPSYSQRKSPTLESQDQNTAPKTPKSLKKPPRPYPQPHPIQKKDGLEFVIQKKGPSPDKLPLPPRIKALNRPRPPKPNIRKSPTNLPDFPKKPLTKFTSLPDKYN